MLANSFMKSERFLHLLKVLTQHASWHTEWPLSVSYYHYLGNKGAELDPHNMS